MKKWKAWIWMLIIFVSGAAVGSGVTVLVVQNHFRSFRDKPPKEIRRNIFERFSKRLDLTEEQKEKARPIIEKSFKEGHAIMEANKPKLDAIMKRTREELEPILTEDQLKKFDRIIKRLRRHGPPPGPPI